MQSMSYKEFIKQVKNRLSKMSKADLDDMILHWAEKELPSNRPNFIGKMIVPEPGDLNTADGEALLGEIDAFTHRVENGDYCIGWGWDNDIYEERDWGDESWILLLEKQSTILPNPMLREAIFLKGGIPAVSKLARQQADKYPRAFIDWIQALEDEDKTDAIIDVAREGLLYRILILGGRYVKLFELCKRKGSLGWSGGNNPKPYFINYTMVLLSDNGKYTKVINNEWDALLTDSAYVVDSNLTDKYKKIIAHTSNNIELTEEQKAFYLQWCSKEIGKRVDAIIGNQYRKSYYKAANLLVAMAETMANMGEKQKGVDLIEKYRKKYPRHSAFKGDLNHSIKESGLLC